MRTMHVDSGAPAPVTWNPQKLGIGPDDRDLPVFVGEHTISRLHERMALYGESGILHRMMYDSLDRPRLEPTEGADGFLVEAGRRDAKLGYFVVEVYADFVFVKTFLFLTMQGTPEARCLRQKLGLSRKDIEYFKLDNFFTLACSDLGEDPELRRLLASAAATISLIFPIPNNGCRGSSVTASGSARSSDCLRARRTASFKRRIQTSPTKSKI